MQELRGELDLVRQLVEGKSDIIKLSDKAAESVVTKIATTQYKSLEKQVLVANEKANENEQYVRNWCLRVYGVTIPKEDVSKVGHVRAAKEAAYNAIIAPIFNSLAEKGNFDASEVPSAGNIIENCHAIGKEVTREGKVLPPPIIIRFMRRDIRDLIIKNRKLLPKEGANFKFKVVEDLTPKNYARLKVLIEDKRVEKVWTIQGRFRLILAEDPTKKVINCQGSAVDVSSLVKSLKKKE